MGDNFGKSFDAFLEATAEAAITHVVSAAKGILSTVTIYVVGFVSLEYNDEYHYRDGGGIIPECFFLDRKSATDYVRERTMELFRRLPDDAVSPLKSQSWSTHSVLEIGGEDDNPDLVSFVRDEMKKEPWDVTYAELIEFCEAHRVEPLDYLPELLAAVEVNPR